MLGDAVSHTVLPGIAIAFIVGNTRNSLPMFIGAIVAGIVTAFLTQWIHRIGKVDEGASMGVVFTTLFAIGLILVVNAADQVDLDVGCVLYGAIELTPLDQIQVFGVMIPRAVVILGSVLLLNLVCIGLFYKEFKITAFDPALATSLGISPNVMHYFLMVLVAVTAVASFESVGNILVVAMFIVPPATAFLLTKRLRGMLIVSASIAALSAVGGHLSAIYVPRLFGFQSTSTASMMAVVAGGIFLFVLLKNWLLQKSASSKARPEETSSIDTLSAALDISEPPKRA